MNDDWTDVDEVTDGSGKTITISHAGGLVRFAVKSPAGIVLTSIVLDGPARDTFMRAFAAAELRAEEASVGG